MKSPNVFFFHEIDILKDNVQKMIIPLLLCTHCELIMLDNGPRQQRQSLKRKCLILILSSCDISVRSIYTQEKQFRIPSLNYLFSLFTTSNCVEIIKE